MIQRILMTLVVSAIPALAVAGPEYTAQEVIERFSGNAAAADACPAGKPCLPKTKTRAVCIGTAAACAKQEAETTAAAAPPSAFDLLITFELGSDRLSGQAQDNLREFAKALTSPELSNAQFNVDGHTDARGSEGFNLTLSERRAQSVVRFLEELGVSSSRLNANGYGESRPRDTDPFAAINRRVEATIRTQ